MAEHVERIAQAYVEDAGGDRDKALRAVIADALEDLGERERRVALAERMVSRGYVRKPVAECVKPRVGKPAEGELERLTLSTDKTALFT